MPNRFLSFGSRLDSAIEQAVDQIVSIGLAILSIVVILVVARFVVKMLRRFFWRRVKRTDIDPNATVLINNAISVLVYFAAVTLLLSLAGASWSTLLTAISISTLAVVLGLQDLLKSLLGGAFVILDQPFSVGDRISISGVDGEVIDVGLRTTTVRSDEGHRITIPNAAVLTSPLQNNDRSVTSETTIRVEGVRGVPETLHEEISTALEADPPITASVSVVPDQAMEFRDLLKKFGISGGSRTSAASEDSATRIIVSLPAEEAARKVERDVVKRLRTLFPKGKVTVRRGTTRG